jgi:hypothetical protein
MYAVQGMNKLIKNYLITFMVSFVMFPCFSQVLEISFVKFGKLKKYHIAVGDLLQYKVNDERKYWKDRIVSFGDSTIVFTTGQSVGFSQLRKIKLRNPNHLIKVFKSVFIMAGILFIIVDTSNNAILGRDQLVNEKSVLISAALIGTGLLLRRAAIIKLRINKDKTLRVINLSYNNLAP